MTSRGAAHATSIPFLDLLAQRRALGGAMVAAFRGHDAFRVAKLALGLAIPNTFIATTEALTQGGGNAPVRGRQRDAAPT